MGTVFRGTNITYFDEYRFFTYPASVGAGAFSSSGIKRVTFPEGIRTLKSCFGSCSLEKLILPSTLGNIGIRVFYGPGYGSCEDMVIYATTPPALEIDHYSPMPGNIYVPDDSVEAYKAASVWSSLASRIKPLSEFTE